VIGVLSGGYPGFFNGQPTNGYGTVSFYQPLYLYWDWIAANNPYRYVGANAGSGNWEDPSRRVSLTDPNYFILGPDGQPINGVPTLTGVQNTGTAGKFGQTCFQNTTSSQSRDVRTGITTTNSNPIGMPKTVWALQRWAAMGAHQPARHLAVRPRRSRARAAGTGGRASGTDHRQRPAGRDQLRA